MWHNPGALNRISDLLFTLAILLVVYGVMHVVVHQPVFALREVRVEGTLAHVTSEQIEAIAKRELKGNFFTLKLAAARSSFETLPWVRRVEVRRQWPDRLDIKLEEHLPLARWGSAALVNSHGEVFRAAYDGKLPLFVGPDGAAKEVAIQYDYFRRSLAAIGKIPQRVQVSPRRAWQVQLEDGLTLELGRDQVEARLARFVAAYDRTLGQLGRRIDYVDLRYANGFAVRIPELKHEKIQPKAAKGAA